MSYNPVEGRWTARDPIGFAGGDADLYRFVGDSPVSNTDPSGLVLDGTMPNFYNQLRPKVTPDERKILQALLASKKYQDMIRYLANSTCHFKFVSQPGLFGPIGGRNETVPGWTNQPGGGSNPTTIYINPTFNYPFPNQPNPAEIANTILHELIHAVLIAKQCAKNKKTCPLDDKVNDISHDPRIRQPNGDIPILPIPIGDLPTFPGGAQGPLQNEYGREPILPGFFGDINGAAKGVIQGEMKGIIGRAGVGSPVVTSIPW